MNEIDPRMKRKSPLPFTKPWGAPSSLPNKLSCRDDTFLSGRSEILFITRLIGSAVDTRETSTRQAKRVRGQQELCFHFFVEIEVKFLRVGIMHAGQVKKRTSLSFIVVLMTSSLKP